MSIRFRQASLPVLLEPLLGEPRSLTNDVPAGARWRPAPAGLPSAFLVEGGAFLSHGGENLNDFPLGPGVRSGGPAVFPREPRRPGPGADACSPGAGLRVRRPDGPAAGEDGFSPRPARF